MLSLDKLDKTFSVGRTGRLGHPGKAISFFDSGHDANVAAGIRQKLKLAKQNVPQWLEEFVANPSAFGDNCEGGDDNREHHRPSGGFGANVIYLFY